MSTRQRATLDMTADPVPEGALLLAHTSDDGAMSRGGVMTLEPADAAAPTGDIAAQRLRALAERLSGAGATAADGDLEAPLAATDAEFGPVSLASLMELRNKQAPDTPGDSLVEPAEIAEPDTAHVAEAPVPNGDEAPSDAPVIEAPEPLRLAGEPPKLLAPDAPADASAETAVALADETVAQPQPLAAGEPLMLADQSTTDIRLVDLIRRQQTLLDQLNRFPPSYDNIADRAAHAERVSPEPPPPRSIVEQLAPPPAVPTPDPAESEREVPPPLPPPERPALPREERAASAPPERIALPPPQPVPPPKRERQDEPAEHELPQHSPMIIQRARAERSGRYGGGQTVRPPSAIPAFLAGLAAALVIAGALFVVL